MPENILIRVAAIKKPPGVAAGGLAGIGQSVGSLGQVEFEAGREMVGYPGNHVSPAQGGVAQGPLMEAHWYSVEKAPMMQAHRPPVQKGPLMDGQWPPVVAMESHGAPVFKHPGGTMPVAHGSDISGPSIGGAGVFGVHPHVNGLVDGGGGEGGTWLPGYIGDGRIIDIVGHQRLAAVWGLVRRRLRRGTGAR